MAFRFFEKQKKITFEQIYARHRALNDKHGRKRDMASKIISITLY